MHGQRTPATGTANAAAARQTGSSHRTWDVGSGADTPGLAR